MGFVVALIVDESKWLTISMGLALVAVGLLLHGLRHRHLAAERRVLAAMNLFFGVTIGMMAFGHLLAVTTKLWMGTLEGPIVAFYAIGGALAVPSWWLILHTRAIASASDVGARTLALNAWLSLTLLALGLHNFPLAMPGFLNSGYNLRPRPLLRWAIVSASVIVNVGLFIGSVLFLASGRSFEEFRGTP